MALWDGRFDDDPAEEMLAFSQSLDEDLQLFEEDIAGSLAHVTMLGEVGILTHDEVREIRKGLLAVRQDLRGRLWRPEPELEDLHMAVETRLIEKVGEVGGKLHTARSRNDQVAVDVRLWLKRSLEWLDATLARLLGVLLDRVDADGRTLCYP